MNKHHPSCRESDRDLVWHCSQCGLNENAESVLEAAKKLCKVYFDIAAKAIGEDEVRKQRDEIIAKIK
jgi:hypothetical protein